MRLGEKQELFSRLIPKLLTYARTLGYEVRCKELQRGREQAEYNAKHCAKCRTSKRQHKLTDHEFRPLGIADSLHCVGLALDLVLFNQGRPLWATRRYTQLGVFWESLDPQCAWGGRFNDGGHFSIRHGGRR